MLSTKIHLKGELFKIQIGTPSIRDKNKENKYFCRTGKILLIPVHRSGVSGQDRGGCAGGEVVETGLPTGWGGAGWAQGVILGMDVQTVGTG